MSLYRSRGCCGRRPDPDLDADRMRFNEDSHG
jgi:hypothetical protein